MRAPGASKAPHGPHRPRDPAMPNKRRLASYVLRRIDICTQLSKRGDSKSLCMRELEKSAASNNDDWNEKKKFNHNNTHYYEYTSFFTGPKGRAALSCLLLRVSLSVWSARSCPVVLRCLRTLSSVLPPLPIALNASLAFTFVMCVLIATRPCFLL